MTLDTILRESRYVSPLAGSLRASVVEAAMELGWTPTPLPERKRLPEPEARHEFDPEHADRFDSKGRPLARWRRSGIHGEKGQGLAEYALILALIAVISVVALLYLGGQISAFLNQVGESI